MRNARRWVLVASFFLPALISSATGQTLRLQTVVTSGITNPMFVTAPPGDTNRLFVAERSGRIRIVNLANNSLNATPYLSISVSTDGERGLLGMAFDPNFSTNGYFYVNYSAPAGADVGDQIIARYQANGDPLTATSANPTEFRLLRLDRPSPSTSNHNGGWIGFNPNNPDNLYIAVGDGGGGDDTFNTAQNVNSPHGKMLRIDVNHHGGGQNYGIPAGNPFATGGGLPEIWALGLRNPWRDSFDRATGDLWIGDVGQSAREEIDYLGANTPGGRNLGWSFREGDIAGPKSAPNPVPGTGLVQPLVVHGRSEAASITGGYVYRGGITSLQGQYIYGDYITGRSWSLKYDGTTLMGPVERTSQFDPDGIGPLTMANQLASFGEDGFGEMYMVAIGRSAIYRIVESANEWGRTTGSTWHTTGNWNAATIPNSNADIARFWNGLTSDGIVDIGNTNTTVKSLSFRNGVASYTIGTTGNGRLMLAANTGNASINFENLNYRDHTISAPLTLRSNLDVKLGAGRRLTLTGSQDWGGRAVTVQSGVVRYAPASAALAPTNTAGASLTIASGATVDLGGLASATSDGKNHVNIINNGTLSAIGIPQAVGTITGAGNIMLTGASAPSDLTASHVRQTSVTLSAGNRLSLRSGGGTSVLNSLSIAPITSPLGRLNLNNNALIIDYTGPSPLDIVRGEIRAGRGRSGPGASWMGPGISSGAAAAANAIEPESRSLGYAENSALSTPYTSFKGQPVDSTSVLIAYTRTADANLDGVVDNNDVTIVGANYAPGIAKPSWALGDFDYNGFVDDDDVTLLGVFYNPSATPIPAPETVGPNEVSAVPEPQGVTLLISALSAIALAMSSCFRIRSHELMERRS